jgi:hypothetical protein
MTGLVLKRENFGIETRIFGIKTGILVLKREKIL